MKSRSLLFVLLAAMFFPMAVNAQETFTVYSGTTTYNANIPFNGANVKYAQRDQMIYPASLLSDLNGKNLTAMTFYVYGSPTGDLGNWVVSLAETSSANFSSVAFNTTALTQVYEGPMVFNANRTEMTVYFDNGFQYNGGNLLVQFGNPVPVNSSTANSAYNFYCSAQLSANQAYSYQKFANSAVVNTRYKYLPRTTFTYDSENTNSKPTDLAINNYAEGASTADLSWTSSASAWNVDVNGTVTSVTSNQFTLTDLVVGTPCVIKVQADFGGGETSDWATKVFMPHNQTTIGSGTASSSNLPSNTNYKYSLTQQILTPEEIGDPGQITGIDLYNASSTTVTRKLNIFMVYTDKESFTNTDDRVVVALTDLVYGTSSATGGANVTFAANEWTHIEFTTPFDYDGGSNVLLVIDDNQGNYNEGSRSFRKFTTTEKQAMYFVCDGGTGYVNPNPTAATWSGDVSSSAVTTEKNQIRVHKGNAPTCPKPINLAVNQANGATTALVTWTSDASEFNIDIDGTVTHVYDNQYTMTNLVMNTTHTIKVQADCGGGDLSDWSRTYTFIPTNVAVLGEGTTTCTYLPTDTYYKYSLSYQILTTEELGSPAPITGIEFYNNSANTSARTFTIYMLTTDKDSFTNGEDYVQVTSANKVYGNTGVTFAANGWTRINFTTPFDYDGSSNVLLVVDDNKGSFVEAVGSIPFRSYTASGNQSLYFRSDDTNYDPTKAPTATSNVPTGGSVTNTKSQMRIIKGNGPSCLKPLFLTVNHENAATTAQVSWESDAEAWNISVNGTVTAITENPYTLTNLNMETTYTIKVQADCGGGDVSAWSDTYTFKPTNLGIAGEGTATNGFLPTNTYYKYTLTQQIFTPEEIGDQAVIKGIDFFYNDEASSRTLQIYMLNTDKDSFEDSNDWTQVTTANRVFSGTVNFVQNDWTYIPFSTTFDYDAGSNVLLIVDDNTGSYTVNYQPLFRSYTTTEYQAIYYSSDDTNLDPTSTSPTAATSTLNPDNAGTIITSKSQVRFHKGNAPTCPKPIHVAVNYNGGQTAEVTWESDAESFDIMRGTTTVATGVTGNSYTLTNLSLGTTYNVKVRANCGGGDLSEWTTPVSFTVDQYASMCDIHYTLTDSYNDGWFDNSSTPKQHKLLVRKGTTTLYTLTLASGESPKTGTLHIQDDIDINFYWQKGGTDYNEECGFVFTDAYGKLIFEGNGYDGSGEMGTYHMNCDSDSFELAIDGYGDGDGKWYLITSPVDFAKVENVENCIDEENEEDYDLFYFDQAAEDGLEWRNYKVESFTLEPGKGYLYANKHDVTLVFTGHPYSGTGSNIPLTYSEGASWAGWNLVGNPLDVPAWPSRDWYWMNNAGTDIILSEWDRPAEPMEGVFVNVVSADENEMSFDVVDSKKGTDRSIAGLSLNLSQGRSVIDRAIVRFDEASPMPKFQLNTSHTKVYIPQGGQDYAMVYSEGMGELPVSFKAEKNGNYTLNSNALGVSFSYLHLIDNMTGADVDLLATPSYTFEARTTDYASRFRLVFVCGDANDDNDFAFFSNGNWVISNDGEATVQVIDMVGRILKSETISGNASISINAAPGVYMLRLINNENMKVQKVVVR